MGNPATSADCARTAANLTEPDSHPTGILRRLWRYPTLGFLAAMLPGAAMGCGIGDPVDANILPDSIWTVIENAAYSSRAELMLAPGQVILSAGDLNGDGRVEYCAALETALTCSNGKAVCLYLVLADDPARVLLEDTSHGLALFDGETNGWRGLTTTTQMASGPETTFVVFDGTAYQYAD